MDFTLSLTHFCESHGPKSVLCTQILPVECARCLPPSPPLRARHSSDSISTQVYESNDEYSPDLTPTFARGDTNNTLPTDFSGASTTVDSEPDSPNIEKHPLFRGPEANKNFSPQYRYGRAQGETCASCSFTVRQDVADKLPAGAPGSFKPDGKEKNGAPVFRSRQFVCLGSHESNYRRGSYEHASSQGSKGSSLHSFDSRYPHADCHDHTLTYITAKSPDDPQSYALLRSSVIRTLSCELLPKGVSDGPLCFGDSNTGYTIAYVFRLTDPKARGRRRAYAFVALAGKDASRAFRACPMLWETFASMAKGIEHAAQRNQDEQVRREEEECNNGKRNYTPVSSFLTQRAVDPDGHPRRAGQTTPRSLAEIVGNENIFAILHRYFVVTLRCLGDRFGGLPLADKPSINQTLANEEGLSEDRLPQTARAELVEHLNKLRVDDATPKPPLSTSQNTTIATAPSKTSVEDEIDLAKAKINKTMKINKQCAPMTVTVSENASRQVVV